MKPTDVPCRLLLVLLCLSCSAPGAAPETGKEKLRTLIRLPTLNMQAGFGFGTVEGFKLLTEDRDFPVEIAKLRQQLAATPADAAVHFQLGKLLRDAGDRPAATVAFGKAVELYRARSEAQPANGPLLAALAEALGETDRAAEAESKFREAVRLSPQDWKCWLSLAGYASSQATELLIHDSTARTTTMDQLVAYLASHKPAAEQVRRSQEWVRESKTAFDRAAELAPQEADVFLRRGMNTGMSAFLGSCIAWLRGEGEAPDFLRELYCMEALPDFKKAARLDPQNYRVNATALLFELSVHSMRQPEARGIGALWSALPELARQSVGHGLHRLEQIAEGPNVRDAAGAAELLGLFRLWVQGDADRAAASCQRAVTLDPAREQAWDVLAGLLASADKNEELLRVCESRVRQRDTARNRLLLAKTLFRLKREDQAAEQVKLALQRSPDDFIARLARAALLLRRPRDPGALAEAGRLLRQAGDRMSAFAKASSNETQTRQCRVDLTILIAVCAAMEDDFPTARKLVKQILDTEPHHEYAKEIQSALGR